MAKAKDSEVAFGEIQGTTIEGVEAYSNGSDMYFSGERNYDGEIMTGFKWQCVEFARRWLLERKGLLLPDLPWACMIFVLKEVERVADGSKVRTLPIKNGGRNKPEPGLLIWPSTEDNFVGHVAAITEVGDDWVRVADQNHTFHKWTGHFGRQLKVKVENGTYTIIDSDGHTVPLGWVTFPGVPDRDRSQPLVFAPQYKRPEPGRMYLDRITFTPENPKENWLDLTNAAEKKFVETFGMDVSRSRLNEGANYYKCSWELMLACVKAGSQLHQMFLKATEHVLASDELLSRFGIDPVFWPRIRNSFVHEKDCITGRFDFAFKDNDIKCFEYNADSASTLLECSRIQEKWAESVGITEGSRSSGFRLQSLLRYAWKETGLHGRLHLLIDDDDEEEYTALTVGEGAVAAGMEIKLCKMFDEFHWKGGHIYDKDGVQVKTVWKTWMWESAISDYYKAQQERPADWKPHDGDAVRLCDLMLGHSGIRVFEPIWKLIPSNKAILPVLYELFPGHPNLLPTFWDLTPELQKSGYVRKPIVGRVGRNVTVCDSTGELLKQSEGNFGDRDMIYQQLFSLPKRDDYYAILGGWIIGNGYYGGTGIREDKTIITGVDSPFSALRIVMDPVVGMPKAINHDNVDAELAAALEV